MKTTRREFNMLAGVSAAGLIVPALGCQAQVEKNMPPALSTAPPPAPGKNIHPCWPSAIRTLFWPAFKAS